MPVSKTKLKNAAIAARSAALPSIPKELLDQFVTGPLRIEVQGFLADQYGVDVSPEFISSVTDAVMAELGAWQARPLESM